MVRDFLLRTRERCTELPAYLYVFCFSWLYTTRKLRAMAARSCSSSVQILLLRRSGVSIGKQVHVNYGDLVQGGRRKPCALTLKDRVAVGPYVTFVTSSAPNESHLRDHPEVQSMICNHGPIVVEEDVWIGAHVVLFPGVRIGRGAIIGAGAVVNRDVSPYTVVAGVPARPLRTLHDPDVAESADRRGIADVGPGRTGVCS